MGTTISEIGDLFLTKIDDYRITAIYATSGSSGVNNFIEPWLLDSIVKFNICTQDLTYAPTSGSSEGAFSQSLTLENELMLSEIMVLKWLEKTVNNVLQMNNFITDKDFHTYSQAQNLDSKKAYYSQKREEVEQRLQDYDYRYNIVWANWRTQNFINPGE